MATTILSPYEGATKQENNESVSQKTKEAMLERRQREFMKMQAKFTGEKPSFILYMILTMFAAFKDLSDLMFGLIPVVGMAVALIFGSGIMTLIYLLLMVFDRSGGKENLFASRAFVKRLLILMATMIIDIVPFLNFLPLTTLSVLLLYWMAKNSWKKSSRQSVSLTRQYSS